MSVMPWIASSSFICLFQRFTNYYLMLDQAEEEHHYQSHQNTADHHEHQVRGEGYNRAVPGHQVREVPLRGLMTLKYEDQHVFLSSHLPYPQVRKVMVQQWREQQDEVRRVREAEAAEARRRAEERRRIELEERQLVNKMKLDLHKQVKVRWG